MVNGERLVFPGRIHAPQFDVAAPLGVNVKIELREDRDHIVAGEATKLRHAPARTPLSRGATDAEPGLTFGGLRLQGAG